MSRFEQYIFPFVPEYHNWKRYANPRTGFSSKPIPNTHFYTGHSVLLEPDIMEVPHTHHGVDEYLIFTGSDMADFFGSDFEIDLFLGEDPDHMELFTITSPTVVRVPPNLWHCPINFRKVGRGVNFMPVYLDTNWSKITRRIMDNGWEEYEYQGSDLRHCVLDHEKMCTFCGKCFSDSAEKLAEQAMDSDYLAPFYEMSKTPRSGKIDKWVHEFRKEYHDLGDAILSPRCVFPGGRAIDGARLNYSHNIIVKPTDIGDEPHFHDAEEYLWFYGCDLLDVFGSFDAEIEVWLGDDPDHMEKFVFDRPSVVAAPPRLWHGPIKILSAGKPVNFTPWYLGTNWSKVTRKTLGGKSLLVYEGEGVTPMTAKEDRIYSGS